MGWLPWSLPLSAIISRTGLVLFLVVMPTCLVAIVLWVLFRRRGESGRDLKTRHRLPDYDDRD